MKKFFSSKLNLILTILLLISIACVSFLLFDIFKNDVIAQDFTNSDLNEVKQWASQNNIEDKVTFTYEFDEDIKENYVIYQSLKEGETITNDGIEIIISKGKDPSAIIPLPEITDSLSESEFSKWCITNEINNVKYQYLLSDISEGNVISFNKEGSIARNDNLIVNISVGQDEEKVSIIVPDFSTMSKEDISLWASGYEIEINYAYEKSTDFADETFLSQAPIAGEYLKLGDEVEITLAKKTETTSADSIIVPDTYLWYSESDFIKAIESLGLIAVKGSSTHSNKSHNTGEVYAYQSTSDGYNFKKGDSVTYYLINNETEDSIVVPDTYLGLSESEFISKIESLGLKANKQSKTYKSKKYQTGNIYAYDSTSDGLSFKKGDSVKYWLVDNGETSATNSTSITVPDTYLGKTESEFVSEIEKLGLKASKQTKTYKSKKYQSGTIYAYDSTSDGLTFKTGDTVKYWLVDNGENSTVNDASIIVPDTYLGMKETEFIEAIEKLGLKVNKQEKTFKSGKYQTGTIYAYDSSGDGLSFKTGDSVKYWLVDNNETSTNEETSNISYITVPDSYLFYYETNFINAIEKLGLKASKAGSKQSSNYQTGQVYAYQSSSDGYKFVKGDTVKYYVVDNGETKQDSSSQTTTVTTFTLQNLVGKTKTDVATYCQTNGLNVTYTESYSNSVTEGSVMSMSPSAGSSVKKGDNLTVEISKGKQVSTASILSANMLISNYSKSTYSDSEKAIKEYFNNQGFTNVSVSGVASSKSVGQIVSISVNGNTKYSAGDYDCSSTIIIEIVNSQYN